MKNKNLWKPSKYIFHRNKLIASRDKNEVSVGSRLISDLVAENYFKAIPKYAQGRLLDLGCGKAPLYIVYKDYASEITCIDWGNSLHANDYIDQYCDLSKSLPIERERYDSIILSDVLEHIPEPMLLCKEINRILSSSGYLILNVPFFYWLHETPFDFYRYTEFALRRMLSESGFEIVEMKAIGGSPEIAADFVAKHLTSIPILGDILSSSSQRMAHWFVSSRIGGKVSAKSSKKFPLGYFVVAKKYL